MRKEVLRFSEGYQFHSPVAQGVKANGFLFFGAIRGTDPETNKVPEDVDAQCRNIFRNLEGRLRACGAELADVVRIAVYMKDLGDREIFNRYWKEAFGDEPPARFAVQVLDMGGPGDASRILIETTALAPEGK
jgi:2-iminobutanoate/2-iminopropanoate deaminase